MGKDKQRPKAIFGDQCRQKVALAIELRRAWVKTSKGQRQFLAALVSKNCLWPLLVFTHARRSSMAKGNFWRPVPPKSRLGHRASARMGKDQQKPKAIFGDQCRQKVALAIELRRAWVKTSRSQRQFLETSAAKKSPWPSSFGAHG